MRWCEICNYLQCLNRGGNQSANRICDNVQFPCDPAHHPWFLLLLNKKKAEVCFLVTASAVGVRIETSKMVLIDGRGGLCFGSFCEDHGYCPQASLCLVGSPQSTRKLFVYAKRKVGHVLLLPAIPIYVSMSQWPLSAAESGYCDRRWAGDYSEGVKRSH